MYNRYERNDSGTYERIRMQDTPQKPPEHKPETNSSPCCPSQEPVSPSLLSGILGKNGLLSGILEKLKLDDLDTEDLLLLMILFLLFRDGKDDELLIALGLLFIL
ncbi:MAG: hypothetical protein IKC03_00685 [Oscillospiraceae bacterium]|nr:hypothetical protein [Oscillospiraceae bacterium]